MSAPWGPGPPAWGPAPTAPWRPAAPNLRRPQAVAYPLVTTILGSIVLVWIVAASLVARRDPGTGGAAIALCALAAALGAAVLLWFDRWEPEPRHLLVAAFFWGIGVVPLAGLFTEIFDAFARSGSWQGYVLRPLFAELFKLCFLLLVLLASRRGRNELTSLADAVAYAGFVGLGQGFALSVMTVGGMHTWSSVLRTGFEELVLGAYVQPVAAIIAACGLWLAITARMPSRVVAPVLAFAGAVCLSILSGWASDWVAVVARLVALALLIWWVRRAAGEQDGVLSRHLPALVQRGWVDPRDAAWLGDLEARRTRRKAARAAGPTELNRVDALRDNVSELAFVRERLDAQHAAGRKPGRELLAQHDELVGLLQAYRDTAPPPPAPPTPPPPPSGWTM
ncbi:hypothetical protein [Mariniluteicoccus flavus]